MRIACLERDNVTQLSNPGNNNDAYSASFELFPFYEGSSYSLYKGIMNGDGHLRGQFCVVRAILDIVAEEKDWTDMMRRTNEAQKLAREFNKLLGYTAIRFKTPMLTQIETLSDFTCFFRCFKPHDKRLKVDEYVTIEQFIDGHFQRFDSNVGSSSGHITSNPNINKYVPVYQKSEDERPRESDVIQTCCTTRESSTNIIQAFSHFTWHFTHKLLVCSLQGVNNGLAYTLTNPVIHSTDSHFGTSDGSTSSLAEFFSYHRCNNICRNWEKCGNTGKSQRQVNFMH